MQDLLGSQIPALISVVATALPHVQSNSLRALVMSGIRSEVRFYLTFQRRKRHGYPGMQAVEWFGIFVPGKDTSCALSGHSIQRCSGPCKLMSFKSGLAKQSFEVAGMPPADLVTLIKADTERWGGIVKASGFDPID